MNIGFLEMKEDMVYCINYLEDDKLTQIELSPDDFEHPLTDGVGIGSNGTHVQNLVYFEIIKVEKMSGTVEYAKLKYKEK